MGDIFTYAISGNGRFIYLSFDVGQVETYRAERASETDPFGDFTLMPTLVSESGRSGLGITGVTNDDCEVFGWSYDLSGNNLIYHARRGG